MRDHMHKRVYKISHEQVNLHFKLPYGIIL